MADKESRITAWGKAWQVYTHPRVLGMLFLGFSAGLPYLLVFGTLSAWLTQLGIEKALIGFISWIGLTYSVKVFWAPFIDRLRLPFLTRWLGKRRAWMLTGQLGIVAGLTGMGLCYFNDPQTQLIALAVFAFIVAFSSATQDISIDAYRIEAVDVNYQGAMAATYSMGYRLAILVSGAGALYIADYTSWNTAYLCMAALGSTGILTTLKIAEPDHSHAVQPSSVFSHIGQVGFKQVVSGLFRAIVSPLVEFCTRNGPVAIVILALIGLYRFSDITLGVMANPFYLDAGYSLSDIASIGKIFGVLMTAVGALVGGVVVARYGIMGPLLAGASMSSLTNLIFAYLAAIPDPSLSMLAVAISADNLSAGFAGTAFIAYLSAQVNQTYTAGQYALFSSLMTLPGKFVGGFSGVVVENYGYSHFFVYSMLVGLPAIILILFLLWHQKNRPATSMGNRNP